MVRVLYDGAVYGMQVHGGVSRYFSNLMKRLPENFTPILTTCQLPNVNFTSYPKLKIYYYNRFGFRPGRLSYWIEKYYFRLVTAYTQPALIHPTYYSLLTRKSIENYRQPIVITVYDMIHELFAEQMDFTGQQIEEKRKAILAASAIICISENTKKDLLERYSLPDSKVTVTYLSSELDISMAYGPEPVPSLPYYLYVGGRTVYKNFDRLLSAFAKAASVQPKISLCVVGPPFNEAEQKLIADLKLTDRLKYYGYASDRHLAKLYRCSTAFVYPSLYEGFGIPLLEAMSCQTPVVASNCSSIPEVVGNAGLLFNPRSISELADILLFLLDNPAERDRMIAKGQQRAKAFTWEQTVTQTIDVYRSLIN